MQAIHLDNASKFDDAPQRGPMKHVRTNFDKPAPQDSSSKYFWSPVYPVRDTVDTGPNLPVVEIDLGTLQINGNPAKATQPTNPDRNAQPNKGPGDTGEPNTTTTTSQTPPNVNSTKPPKREDNQLQVEPVTGCTVVDEKLQTCPKTEPQTSQRLHSQHYKKIRRLNARTATRRHNQHHKRRSNQNNSRTTSSRRTNKHDYTGIWRALGVY